MHFETVKFQCYYCREYLTDLNRTKDHVIPKSKGGKLSKDNKVFACRKCNRNKGDLTIEEWIEKLKVLKCTPKTKKMFGKKLIILPTLYGIIETLINQERWQKEQSQQQKNY
jgi:CRISPR/Cas system Type II protein with McrA/HNH and RuvC-like nuclease domain